MRPQRNLQLMNDSLTTELQKNVEALTKELSRFNYEDFNRVPATGGWTPGQIAEHLLIFDIRALTTLSGKTQPVDRDPQELFPAILARLTNREHKSDAPPFLIPTDTSKDPAALTDKLIAARRNLIQFVTEHNMDLLLPDMPHRFFGPMTGNEWMQLIILHAKRHLLQLQDIT
jgi:hypothetical protein